MARKTSSQRKSKNGGSNSKSRIPKRSRNVTQKGGGSSDNDGSSDVMVEDCSAHEPDCQCFLRKGIFLPPGVAEQDEMEHGQEQDNQKS